MKPQVKIVVSTRRYNLLTIEIMDIRPLDIVRFDFAVFFSSKYALKKSTPKFNVTFVFSFAQEHLHSRNPLYQDQQDRMFYESDTISLWEL